MRFFGMELCLVDRDVECALFGHDPDFAVVHFCDGNQFPWSPFTFACNTIAIRTKRQSDRFGKRLLTHAKPGTNLFYCFQFQPPFLSSS